MTVFFFIVGLLVMVFGTIPWSIGGVVLAAYCWYRYNANHDGWDLVDETYLDLDEEEGNTLNGIEVTGSSSAYYGLETSNRPIHWK